MAVFLVEYFQGKKKVGMTGPYATRRAAAADAKSMIRNHVGVGYPITELYTSTKTTGKPKMVAPKVMKKEKYADWKLYKDTKRKRYDRKLPTNKVPEVAGYSAQGPKEGVLRASIKSTTATKWANSMKLKYNPAGKKHAVLLRRNGQMYGYFGPYTSKSLADADAAALKAMVPSSITVEASPVSQTRAVTKKKNAAKKSTAKKTTVRRNSEGRKYGAPSWNWNMDGDLARGTVVEVGEPKLFMDKSPMLKMFAAPGTVFTVEKSTGHMLAGRTAQGHMVKVDGRYLHVFKVPKGAKRNPTPAAIATAARGAKMVSKILPSLYAARDYACTPAGRASIEKAINTVCKGSNKSKEQAAQALVKNHNGHLIVGKSGAYVTTVDGKKGTVGHKTLAEAKKAIDNPRKNNPLVEFTTRAGRNVKFEASYTRSKPKKKVVAKKTTKKTATKKKTVKKPTYKAAMKGIYDALKADGWKMSAATLKIPHATKGNVRLYLKAQSIHKTTKKPFKLGDAHSQTFGIDVRDIKNYGTFVKQFNKGVKSNPNEHEDVVYIKKGKPVPGFHSYVVFYANIWTPRRGNLSYYLVDKGTGQVYKSELWQTGYKEVDRPAGMEEISDGTWNVTATVGDYLGVKIPYTETYTGGRTYEPTEMPTHLLQLVAPPKNPKRKRKTASRSTARGSLRQPQRNLF
jgi:hypothetical protein